MRPVGPWGVWSSALRFGPRDQVQQAAAALEDAGCSALWLTGGTRDPFERVGDLLTATRRLTVATGILSIWTTTPAEVAAAVRDLPHGERFLLGLGVSHPSLVDRDDPGRYARPWSRMRDHLAELDATGEPGVARERRVLAALGPRMLRLAAGAAAGAHPYLTTPDHTATARATLGPGPLLAPMQMALLETDATTARAEARRHLAMYLQQPNYVDSWQRLGFEPDDVADGGSDRLVDAMVAWGPPDRVAVRLREHLDAGADHVCVQVPTTTRDVPVTPLTEVLGALA